MAPLPSHYLAATATITAISTPHHHNHHPQPAQYAFTTSLLLRTMGGLERWSHGVQRIIQVKEHALHRFVQRFTGGGGEQSCDEGVGEADGFHMVHNVTQLGAGRREARVGGVNLEGEGGRGMGNGVGIEIGTGRESAMEVLMYETWHQHDKWVHVHTNT